jgi:hypothetical protein
LDVADCFKFFILLIALLLADLNAKRVNNAAIVKPISAMEIAKISAFIILSSKGYTKYIKYNALISQSSVRIYFYPFPV